MPKIPTYTAPGGAAIQQFAPVPHLPFPLDAGGLGTSLQQAGSTLSDIQYRIDKQEAETEAMQAQALYDAGIKKLKDDVLREPDVVETDPKTGEQSIRYIDRKSMFYEQAQQLQKEVLGKISKNVVKAAFAGHVQKTFANALVDVGIDVEKVKAQRAFANTEVVADQYSRLASEAADPKDQRLLIGAFTDYAQRALANKTLTPEQHHALMKRFTTQTLERSMVKLGDQDYDQLVKNDQQGMYAEVPVDKRISIMSASRAKAEHVQQQFEKAYNQAESLALDDVTARANRGEATQAELEAIRDDKNPLVRPTHYKSLQALNDNPPGSSTGSEAIMQEYYASGQRTLATIQRTRQQLRQYASGLTQKDPNLNRALRELQTDEDSVEGRGRAERGVQAAEIAAGKSMAKDLYNEDAKAVLPGIAGAMQKAWSASDRAQINVIINDLVRKGTPADKAAQMAVDRVMKARREQATKPKGDDGKVLDLINP